MCLVDLNHLCMPSAQDTALNTTGWTHGTSSLKCHPDAAGPSRQPLLWPGFNLGAWLKPPISSPHFKYQWVDNFTENFERSFSSKWLNKKSLLNISASPSSFQSPPEDSCSLFPHLQGPLSLSLSSAEQLNFFLACGGHSWGVYLYYKHFFLLITEARWRWPWGQFILEMILLSNSV